MGRIVWVAAVTAVTVACLGWALAALGPRSASFALIVVWLPMTWLGTVSRIVPLLNKGAGVVTTRNDVHYVVTEFGVASLYGKTVRQRAKELINIAHPKFQEELTAAAHELGYL